MAYQNADNLEGSLALEIMDWRKCANTKSQYSLKVERVRISWSAQPSNCIVFSVGSLTPSMTSVPFTISAFSYAMIEGNNVLSNTNGNDFFEWFIGPLTTDNGTIGQILTYFIWYLVSAVDWSDLTWMGSEIWWLSWFLKILLSIIIVNIAAKRKIHFLRRHLTEVDSFPSFWQLALNQKRKYDSCE
jgi:hypothetical protein